MFWIFVSVLLIVTVPLVLASTICHACRCDRRTHDRVLEIVASIILVVAVIYANIMVYTAIYL